MAPSLQPAQFRMLPAVDEVLRLPAVMTLVTQVGRAAVADAVRSVLGTLRQAIQSGQLGDPQLKLALGGLEGAVERQ